MKGVAVGSMEEVEDDDVLEVDEEVVEVDDTTAIAVVEVVEVVEEATAEDTDDDEDDEVEMTTIGWEELEDEAVALALALFVA